MYSIKIDLNSFVLGCGVVFKGKLTQVILICFPLTASSRRQQLVCPFYFLSNFVKSKNTNKTAGAVSFAARRCACLISYLYICLLTDHEIKDPTKTYNCTFPTRAARSIASNTRCATVDWLGYCINGGVAHNLISKSVKST